MSDEQRPDYGDLLASPYDDEVPAEGESSIPWKPPVFAAIAGALVASAFVLYAIVAGPDSAETVDSSTSTTAPTVIASSELPPGFVRITDAVGASVLTVDRSADTARFVVATAVAGGEDPGDVAPVEVSSWSVVGSGAPIPMQRQYGQIDAIGVTTVEFDATGLPERGTLVAVPVTGSVSGGETETLGPELPAELSGEVAVGDATVRYELTIGDGWGYVSWKAAEGADAVRVEVVVTFEGTDDPRTDAVDPTRLLPRHLAPSAQGISPARPAPLYNFAGEEQLLRVGEPLGGANTPEGVKVEIRVTVPEVGGLVEIPFG